MGLKRRIYFIHKYDIQDSGKLDLEEGGWRKSTLERNPN